jgi:hypothetical protein
MIDRVRRYLTAFITALRITLRGEPPPPPPAEAALMRRFPVMMTWTRRTIMLLDEVMRAAASSQCDLKTVTMLLDRRAIAAQTMLDTVRFHAQREYPSLLSDAGQYNPLALRALNLNDHYMIDQLAAHPQLPAPVRSAVQLLVAHLDSLPSQGTAG